MSKVVVQTENPDSSLWFLSLPLSILSHEIQFGIWAYVHDCYTFPSFSLKAQVTTGLPSPLLHFQDRSLKGFAWLLAMTESSKSHRGVGKTSSEAGTEWQNTREWGKTSACVCSQEMQSGVCCAQRRAMCGMCTEYGVQREVATQSLIPNRLSFFWRIVN